MTIKNMMIGVFGIGFCIGILFILKSDVWNMGSFESMHLAGAIISIFSGIGLLCELYFANKGKE